MPDEVGGHAAIVLITTPEGVVMVRELSYSNPLWKFPGGERDNGETPEETARREACEEALDLRSEEIPVPRLIFSEERSGRRGKHKRHFFALNFDEMPPLRVRGATDDEEIEVFKPEEVLFRDDVLDAHKRVLGRALVEGKLIIS